ncbi:MAG: hypothetical protein IJ418_21590 [Clostridia bacterium]|nr:hypothetical protein [Clostridia bacterium]
MNSKVKRLLMLGSVIVAFALLIGFPYFLHKSKWLFPKLMIWGSYELDSILSYYGGVLTFVGTLIVSIIALIQTAHDQEKADEINRLQLEIARRNLQIAEKSFEANDSKEIIPPKFEISAISMSGVLYDFKIEIKNVTSMIISDLTVIDCEIQNKDGIVRIKPTKLKNRLSSLATGTASVCEMHFGSWLGHNKNGIIHETDLMFNLKFSCEDEYFNKFYYLATHPISSTNCFPSGNWKIVRIG